MDRKTVRRYVDAAVAAGLVPDGGEAQLTDELIGVVVEEVRPARPRGHGEAWERCQAERARIKDWLDADVPVVKIGDLLARRGKQVPERTLHRSCAQEFGHGRKRSTMPVVDGELGGEVQVDFGRLGYLTDRSYPVGPVVLRILAVAVRQIRSGCHVINIPKRDRQQLVLRGRQLLAS